MTNFTEIKTEKQAIKVLRDSVGRIYCPKCKKKHHIRSLPDGRYHCQQCRYKFSFKVLLGLKNSKLNYIQIVKLVHYFAKAESLNTVVDHLQVSYQTARLNYSKLRPLLPNEKGKLAGDVITDVMYVGKQKTNNLASTHFFKHLYSIRRP